MLCDCSADLSEDEDSTARTKSTGRRRPRLVPPALSSNPSKPLQVTATGTAKMAMAVQEPQLLDKMENVAYRLNIQADERKKHMNSRYCHACSLGGTRQAGARAKQPTGTVAGRCKPGLHDTSANPNCATA